MAKKPTKKKTKVKPKKVKKSGIKPRAKKAREIALLDEPTPYNFVTTFEKVAGVVISQVNIYGTLSEAADFDSTGASIVCKMKVTIPGLRFGLIIDAIGPPSSAVTVDFTMTVNEKSVFATAQKITFTSTGRGSYSNDTIKLP